MLRNQKRVKSSWIWIIPQSRKSRRVHPSTCQNGKISCQSVKTLSVESFILSFACTARFRVVCVHLVPCVSLVILNILLFSAIRKAERRRQKLMASRVKAEQAGLVKRWISTDLFMNPSNINKNSGNRDNKRQRDAYSTTMMLIVVIAVFLSVETPLMVITALHTISSRWGKTD